MGAGRAWVLNLDAELELAVPAYTPTRAVREALAVYVPIVSASLLEPGDVLIDDATPPGSARGMVGVAFSPTPRALARLAHAGAEPAPHPPASVLRRVLSRAFAASLGPTLPGESFVTDLEAATRVISDRPAVGEGWRVKRAFGMSGRGQRIIAPGVLSPSDETYLRASMAKGGVQIEPNVEITRELAIHGMLAEDGALRVGRVVVQCCDARGRWASTEPEAETRDERDDERDRALRREVASVGVALHAAGYYGPFGLDAFVYRAKGGSLSLRVRSEVNARYTMGFAVGFSRRARSP